MGGSAGAAGATAAQLWPKVYLYEGLGIPRPAAGSVQINRVMYSCVRGATRAARVGWWGRGAGRRKAAGPPWGGRAVEAPGSSGEGGAAERGPAERPGGPGRSGTRRGNSQRALRRDSREQRAGPRRGRGGLGGSPGAEDAAGTSLRNCTVISRMSAFSSLEYRELCGGRRWAPGTGKDGWAWGGGKCQTGTERREGDRARSGGRRAGPRHSRPYRRAAG